MSIRSISILLLISSLIACSPTDKNEYSKSGDAKEAISGSSKLPALIMTDAGGQTINLNEFKGKKVFVNLWATWCPPCRAEIPSIEALASKVGGDGAVFIMLSLDEDFETVKKFAKDQNLKIPFYYPAEKLPELFRVDGIPATFIFNENGDLVKQSNGAEDYNTDFYINLLSRQP